MSALQDSSWLQKYGGQTFEINGQNYLHKSTLSSLPDNQSISERERSLSEGDSYASRLSPSDPPFNGRDVSLNMGAPDSLPDSFLATRQLAPSWNPPLSPFLELDSQLGIFSLRAPRRGPSTYATPRVDTATDLIFTTAPTLHQPSIHYGPVAKQECQVPEWAQDYGAVHAAIRELSLDASTATVPIGEMLVDPATARETLGVPGNGITSSSVYYHSSAIPHSIHRNKDAALLNFISANQSGRHPIASSSIASSIRVARAGRNRSRFSCHACDVGFVQRQGLNRHNRDKHRPQNICPHCGVFKWSPARRYLFTKHFERDHPGVPL
ncbi:hypothetical protein EDB92DRAFT_660250 [Lactarius akahatsu]|uniref:C2H2-type domain-containing protein n=1 Tax=Lactarius akahatsu TaxID=416441 RepID=A0AAD4QDR2_9AGAM|nr:hypothetical protein EDB92DRAFT_660250 [Lactarius akahatsu]